MHSSFTLALKIDPGKVLSKEVSSSPTLLSAYKSSPAWLHWAYDYGGNVGGTVKYKEQVIGFKAASNKTVQALAKRNGAYNVLELESFIPAPFKGRVEVISSNSTLVIHDLQYNDSAYQFLSNIVVDVDVGSGSILIQIALKPNITVNVQGAEVADNFISFTFLGFILPMPYCLTFTVIFIIGRQLG